MSEFGLVDLSLRLRYLLVQVIELAELRIDEKTGEGERDDDGQGYGDDQSVAWRHVLVSALVLRAVRGRRGGHAGSSGRVRRSRLDYLRVQLELDATFLASLFGRASHG